VICQGVARRLPNRYVKTPLDTVAGERGERPKRLDTSGAGRREGRFPGLAFTAFYIVFFEVICMHQRSEVMKERERAAPKYANDCLHSAAVFD
jgi:hypothetical protein